MRAARNIQSNLHSTKPTAAPQSTASTINRQRRIRAPALLSQPSKFLHQKSSNPPNISTQPAAYTCQTAPGGILAGSLPFSRYPSKQPPPGGAIRIRFSGQPLSTNSHAEIHKPHKIRPLSPDFASCYRYFII